MTATLFEQHAPVSVAPSALKPHPRPNSQIQGREANHSGKFLEDAIEREFKRRGIDVVRWRESRDTGNLFHEYRLIKNVPYTSVYGCKSKSEFVYTVGIDGIVRIECRWQERKGSTDEKFCYLLENARHRMPEPNIWLVVDGDGARKKAVEWLKRGAASTSSKLIRVLTLIEAKKAIKLLVEGGVA